MPRPDCVFAWLLLGLVGCSGGAGPLPEDASEAARSAVHECSGASGSEKQDCYERHLLDDMSVRGVAPALASLEAIAAADIDVERNGHVYTHAIGINAYDPEIPVSQTFRQCSTLFQSGCYHGVIQAHFMAAGDIGKTTVSELCDPYREGERWLLFQCLHGLGHGLTMYYGNRLPRALGGCDLLTRPWDQESCYGGVFMENVLGATQPHHPASELASEGGGHSSAHAHGEPAEDWIPLKADEPHYPCSVLDRRYLRACYTMQTSVMLWHNGGDIGAAAESCLEAPADWRRTSFQSLGRDISSHTLQKPRPSLRECGKVQDEYRGWCYVGLVKNFIDLTATTESAFDFCWRVEDRHKARCYEAIGEEVSILEAGDLDRREECTQAPEPAYESACLRGARVSSTM